MTSQQIGNNIDGYISSNNQLVNMYQGLVDGLYNQINDLKTLLYLTNKSKEEYKELYLEARETIKELQSEINASRKDDSRIKA